MPRSMKELAAQAAMERAGNGAHPPRRAVLTGVGADDSLREVLEHTGFTVVRSAAEADFVVAQGGDGSLLGADRDFPQLPKVPLRRNRQTDKCERHSDEAILGRVFRGEHTITRLPRLAAEAKGRRFEAINDIVFHNQNVTSAVRYLVRIDGSPCGGEIVGDGLVVATPFGSSAYYRSITNSVFRVGLGLAFNNSTESVNHMVLHADSVIEVEVTRGPALAVGDNMVSPVTLDRGDVLTVRMSGEVAEIWEIESLFCLDCRDRRTDLPAGSRHV